MNVIAGRGGVISTFLGLFLYLVIGCLYLLFRVFVIAVGIVYLILMGIRKLYLRRKAKKNPLAQGADWNPPAVVMSRVSGNPRDWVPPE